MTIMPNIGYSADILWTDGTRETTFFTVEERLELIGDGRIASATYLPLCAIGPDRKGTYTAAWLVRGTATGDYIVSDWLHAQSMGEAGYKVDALRYAQAPAEYAP